MKIAYYVSPAITDSKGNFVPVIVQEGVKGYFKTDWKWGKSLKIAEECAKDKNAMLGLTQQEVDRLIIQSMF